MRKLLIIVGVVALASITGQAQGRGGGRGVSGTPLTLEVAVRGYLSDGPSGSLAGDSSSDKLESYVWADQTLCGMGAGDNPPSNTPWVGWHFTGNVVSAVSGQLTVRLEWQRMWENGRRSDGPKSGRQLTLRGGERIELDRIAPARSGACGTVEAKLEAGVSTRPAYLIGVPGGVVGGVLGGGVGGVARGSGRGVPGGVTGEPGRGSGAGGGRGSATGGSGSGSGAGRGMEPLQLRSRNLLFGSIGTQDAEIWLVHKRPDGSEIVQQQTVRFSNSGTPFAFPPVQVAGRGGEITLDITGRLQMVSDSLARYRVFQRDGDAYTLYSRSLTAQAGQGRGSGGGRGGAAGGGTTGAGAVASPADPNSPSPLIIVTISRRARRANPFIDTRGTTEMSLQLPKQDDVLSFELPPLQKATEDLLAGHLFSIRLRVTPVK
jgi:hypothetical protein